MAASSSGSSIPGVSLRSGVVLSAGQKRFLVRLREKTPSSVPILVNSSGRTISQQAAAMLGVYSSGGADALHRVYQADDVIDELLANPKTVSAWTAVLERAIAKGKRISRHLAGGAVDIHTKTLKTSQVELLKAGVKAAGGRFLMETAPPHMHVDLPLMDTALDVKEQTQQAVEQAVERAAESVPEPVRKAVPWVVGAGAFAGIAFLLIGIGRRRRSRVMPTSSQVVNPLGSYVSVPIGQGLILNPPHNSYKRRKTR